MPKKTPGGMMADQEKKWQREDDFRTLSRAQEIHADKKRMGAAMTEGERMSEEKMKEAKAMMQVARRNKK